MLSLGDFVLHIHSKVLCYLNPLGLSLRSLTLCHFSASLSHSQATGSVQCTNTEYNKDINQYRHLCINGSQITVNALVNIQEDWSQERERAHIRRENGDMGEKQGVFPSLLIHVLVTLTPHRCFSLSLLLVVHTKRLQCVGVCWEAGHIPAPPAIFTPVAELPLITFS